MLEDLVTKRCGERFSSSLRAVFPHSTAPTSLQTLVQDSTYDGAAGQTRFQENLHGAEPFPPAA
jgi:hypothetical protein